MTKHLIGFGLFSFIFAVFAIAFSLFAVPLLPEMAEVGTPPPVKLREHCNLKRSPRSVGDARAFADRNTAKITIHINEFPGSSHVDSSEINASFAFYSVEGARVRFIDVIHDSLVNPVRRDNETKWVLQYEEEWVRGLSVNETLFVVPGASYGANGPALAAGFSKSTALPVLIRN